jgi:hypothetical protein
LAVCPGEIVAAGQPLGRVGRTGRASHDHLHFEVRLARDPEERWEKARAVDPVAFVAERLPDPRDGDSWARPYLEWAESAALVPPGLEADSPLDRTTWWRMLAAAAGVRPLVSPVDGESLRASLEAAGLLRRSGSSAPSGGLRWHELASDLDRLRRSDAGLPACPVAREEHESRCRKLLGEGGPARHPGRLKRLGDRIPTVAEACLLLADLSLKQDPERSREQGARADR